MSDQWSPTSVQVTVLQARGLRVKGKGGTNDAYAVMQVGKEKFQTSVAEKTVAPVWKEEATFDLPPVLQGGGGGPERCTLQVQVLHRALVGPDKLLGQTVINLLQLSDDKTRNKTEWFKLLDKTGKADKERGEVLLDVQFMRNNMTASMLDLSAAGKSRSRLGKFKNKVRGKKKESDSPVVPSLTQVLTDSEEEEGGNEDAEGKEGKNGKSKKHKMKSLFAPKSNLQRNMSQSMSVLPAKNSSLSGSQSSGLNVDSSEGKKKFKFSIHKRSGSSDNKDSSSGRQKQAPAEQSNLCINGSHIYCDEPPPRTSRVGSNFSLTSSGHGSMEDVPENSPPSVDSLKAVREYSPWMEEEEEEEKDQDVKETVDEEEERIQVKERNEETLRREQEELRLKREEDERIKVLKEEEERTRREENEMLKKQEELEKLRQKEEREAEEERAKREEEERIQKEKLTREEEKRREAEEEQVKREEEERIQKEMEIKQKEEERRKEEEEQKRLAEEQRLEEEKRKLEEERIRREDEEKALERKRQEEEDKLAEEKRLKEEERVRREEEERRQKEELMKKQEQRRQKEEERLEKEEMKRLEEERARKREEHERLMEERRREEEKMRLEEEERVRVEEEKSLKEQEERRRKEEVEMRRREELERLRQEEEEKREIEEQRAKREEEERIQREEEMRRAEEDRLRKEEEERLKREEEKRKREEEEKARKEKEDIERRAEELKRMKEEEKRRMEEEERIRREERAEKERKEEEERKLEEENKRNEEQRATEKTPKIIKAAETTSTNPFDEDFSPPEEILTSTPELHTENDEPLQKRCQPAVSPARSGAISADEKDLINTQREKRPAPQPPGRNLPERGRQNEEEDECTRHLSQINKQSKEKDVKTVSVPPQRSVQMIAPLNRPPKDSKNSQSEAQNNSTKQGKRPAPSRPPPVEDEPPSESTLSVCKTSLRGVMETQQVRTVHSLNPFEDEDDELADATAGISPAASQTDDVSQAKLKSSKVARAPPPPAPNEAPSILIHQNNNDTDETCDPLPEVKRPNKEPENSKVAVSVKEEGPPVNPRRLQTVKPLNPLEQQPASVVQQENNKSTGSDYSGDQHNTKVDAVISGPYSQLTQEELISLVLKQEKQLTERDKKISALELYIDNLLVRVIEEQPSILMSLSALK